MAELAADHKQGVTVGRRLLQRPQPDRRTDRQGVRLVQHTLAVDRGGDRSAERLGESGQFPLRVDRAAAGDDHRRRGGGQHLGDPADSSGISFGRGGFRRRPRFTGPPLLEHVDGDFDVHGPRPGSGETVERLGHCRGGFVGTAHSPTPPHQLSHCLGDVLGLVQLTEVAPLGSGRQTRREHEHRLRLRVRRGGGGHRVGQPGTAGGHHHSRPAGDAGIGLGGVTGALLVPGGDGADTGWRKVPVDLEIVCAGNAEDAVHAMHGEGLDDCGTSVARAGHRFTASTDISS
jgi:hypothetical protein